MIITQKFHIESGYDAALIFFAACIGFAGLSFSSSLTPLILAVPVLWTLSGSRRGALGVMFAYNTAISRGLFHGAAVFLSENHTPMEAVCLWLLMVFGVSLPFGVFWNRRNERKAILFVTAFLVTYIAPPFSLIGIVNPLMASGCLFPGWGFFGFAAMMFVYVLCAMNKRIAVGVFCLVATLPFVPYYFCRRPLVSVLKATCLRK